MRTFSMAARPPAQGVDFAADLDEQQLAVATAPAGPMLVIAGAGSGKTRSLTYRVAHLVRRGADPGRILLVTFTTRAAREMVHRIESLVRQEARSIWAGTFHHVANRLLRHHASAIGLSPEFTILDREDAGDLIARCVLDAGIKTGGRRFPGKNVLVSVASAVANTADDLATVLERRYPMFARYEEAIDDVLARYTESKREHQLLDYDDLLTGWERLLDHDATREAIETRFDHLLVDEYQDTNALQARLVDRTAVRHRSVCVVGDDSQSIYSFRGGDLTNMLRFTERYPEARAYKLETNYRSTPEIVDLANRSIEKNTQRLPKTLRAVRPSGLRPAVVPCGDHFVQSRFIGEYILHLLEEGRGLFDIAVLYRSHWHAMEIQLELQRRDVPFQVRGGQRFFEQAHLKDVLAFLRIRHNGHDELAWQRVLRLVPRIGGAHARSLWERIAASDDPLAVASEPAAASGLPPSARTSFAAFGQVLAGLAQSDAPAEMIHAFLTSFYDDYLAGHYENAELRRQDIEGVADFAGQYRSVEAFLSDVALTGDFDGETCEDGPDEQEFVTLTTVHQAKGLEWPIVLVPWVADGRFPTDLAMSTPEELEEERRVFHVALTRARDELYLVVPQVWSNYQKRRILMKPSRFLTELEDQPDLVETLVLTEELPDVVAGAEENEPPAREG